MRVWNDLKLALHNAFASASLLANVHPDEAVRTRAERAEQDAHKLLTEIGLDRGLYDVARRRRPAAARRGRPAGARPGRCGTSSRAGVDRDEPVRARLRELAERETAVGQEFSKNIRDGVRSVSGRPGAPRRAARRLRREPPRRRGRAGRDHHRLPRLPAVLDVLAATAPPAPR